MSASQVLASLLNKHFYVDLSSPLHEGWKGLFPPALAESGSYIHLPFFLRRKPLHYVKLHVPSESTILPADLAISIGQWDEKRKWVSEAFRKEGGQVDGMCPFVLFCFSLC